MSERHGTSIEWTHGRGYKGETWNPVVGCSKVSPGCAHCYAEDLHRTRLDGRGAYPAFEPWTPANAEHNVTLVPERLEQPLRWREPRMVFVNSMSDLFHGAPRGRATCSTTQGSSAWFVSAEPLLGPLVCDLALTPELRRRYDELGWVQWSDGHRGPEFDLDGIDWLIVGGESGPRHRPVDPEWMRDLRDACVARWCSCCNGDGEVWLGSQPYGSPGEAYAPCADCNGNGHYPALFVKQMGGARPGSKFDDLPEDLRIREYPTSRTEAIAHG